MESLCGRYRKIELEPFFLSENPEELYYRVTIWMSMKQWELFCQNGLYEKICNDRMTELIPLYADTMIYAVGLVFNVKTDKWPDFKRSFLFQEIRDIPQRFYQENKEDLKC